TTSATSDISTLSLHDALPICAAEDVRVAMEECGPQSVTDHENGRGVGPRILFGEGASRQRRYAKGLKHAWSHRGPGKFLGIPPRSEEHTSELQSRSDLVCRLL